jgi:hypothetical protein
MYRYFLAGSCISSSVRVIKMTSSKSCHLTVFIKIRIRIWQFIKKLGGPDDFYTDYIFTVHMKRAKSGMNTNFATYDFRLRKKNTIY